jgi:hypothetical protein
VCVYRDRTGRIGLPVRAAKQKSPDRVHSTHPSLRARFWAASGDLGQVLHLTAKEAAVRAVRLRGDARTFHDPGANDRSSRR